MVVDQSENGDDQGLATVSSDDSLFPDAVSPIAEAEVVTSASAGILAAAFKAVGHPVRLRILETLALQSDPVCACDIESMFSLSQPTISHHLRVLRKAGLVVSERRGTWIYYSVNEDGIGPLYSFLGSITHHSGETPHVNPI